MIKSNPCPKITFIVFYVTIITTMKLQDNSYLNCFKEAVRLAFIMYSIFLNFKKFKQNSLIPCKNKFLLKLFFQKPHLKNSRSKKPPHGTPLFSKWCVRFQIAWEMRYRIRKSHFSILMFFIMSIENLEVKYPATSI